MAHIEYCPTKTLAHIACVAPFRAAGLQAGKRVHKLKVRAACASSPRSKWFSNEKHIQLSRQYARTVTAAVTQSTGESSTALAPDMTKTKVLFVCKGNICRSPAAGVMMKKVVQHSGVADDWVIDSCGTGGSGHENWFQTDHKDHWADHEDKTVDDRMVDALKKRGLEPDSESRPMEPADFQKFDYIICMNDGNVEQVHKAAQYWKDEEKRPIPGNWKDKVHILTKYLVKGEYQEEREVPDPFHGGPEGFEKVLDLLEDACEGFAAHVDSRKFATES